MRTESRLAESEARLASIIDSAKDAILVADARHQITLFNTAAETMFRCCADEAIGQPLTRFIPADFAPSFDSALSDSRLRALFPRMGCQGFRADGDTFPLEASVSQAAENGRKFYTIVARDITERTRAEARIREQAALLDQARDAILLRDMDDNILFWNRGADACTVGRRRRPWDAMPAISSQKPNRTNAKKRIVSCWSRANGRGKCSR